MGAGVSFAQLVRDVAADFGHVPTDDEIDFVLWNHTGYPSFWHGPVIESCARQVDDFYRGVKRCPRCGEEVAGA